MKRILKHKTIKEPNEELVYKLGHHLERLLMDMNMAPRDQNVHITGKKGGTAKTAILDVLVGIFRRAGHGNIINKFANNRFGATGMCENGLYKAQVINDLSVYTLTGAILKSIMECDGTNIDVKVCVLVILNIR